jgi:hypothetical protein
MNDLQLREYAKAYISSGDVQAENGLLRAGTQITPLLMQVFSEELQAWGNRPVKSELQRLVSGLEDLLRSDGFDNLREFSEIKQEIEAMNERAGVSLAVQSLAEEAINRIWTLVIAFGNQGIDSLISQVQSGDSVIRCTSALILTKAEQLSYTSAKRLEATWSFLHTLDMSRKANLVLATLVLTVFAKSRNEEFLKMVDQYCQQAQCSREEFYRQSIHSGLDVVITKGRN